MAAEYVEQSDEDDDDQYGSVDADILYEQYCKKMFRDFKTQRMYENIEK